MSENGTASDPCCGTTHDARRAGACCDPAARSEAVASGAGCCGPVGAGATGRDDLPVVVIGAGPVGLAAAAHLHERGLRFTVVEAGPLAGAAVADWGHVRLFSPWRYNIDHAARRLLDADGSWSAPDPDVLPTGADLVQVYLRPLADLPQLVPFIRYDTRVVALGRIGVDRVKTADRERAPFVVRLHTGEDVIASAVIDASGTWDTPNVLGANGLPAHGEGAARGLIDWALPDVLGAERARYTGKHTVVVGAGHSAANTLLALAELSEQEPGTRITWLTRGGSIDRAVGGGDADALPGRGALGSGIKLLVDAGRVTLVTGFAVHAIRVTGDGAELTAVDGRTLRADRVVSATGFRPDHRIADELRLDLDPALGCTRALAPLIDPNEHSCGTVRPHGVDELTQPEPHYYGVGMKSYGRAPTFLLATGYEQVRSIAAALAGDWETARDVQLDLPETGVCSATAGYKTMLDDATRAAAIELGIDEDIALRLAVLAGDQFNPNAGTSGLSRMDMDTTPSSAGNCCN